MCKSKKGKDMNPTTVGLSNKAFEIAKKVDKSRKDRGLSSSVSAVVSEAIVRVFGNAASSK